MNCVDSTHNKLFHSIMFLFLFGFIFLQYGCATIIKGQTQPISIKSSPTDAKVVIHDLRSGTAVSSGQTPQTLTLERGKPYFRKGIYKGVIEKEGYQKREFLIEGSPNLWYIGGNLIFGGLIGYLILDPLTGAMWELQPDTLSITLREKGYIDPIRFNLTDFKPPYSVEGLCRAINRDKYEIAFKSPDNTVEKLNEILEVPDLFDKINTKGRFPQKYGAPDLAPDIKELLNQTSAYRLDYTQFLGLSEDEQNKLAKLNRRLLEEAYAQETPKLLGIK